MIKEVLRVIFNPVYIDKGKTLGTVKQVLFSVTDCNQKCKLIINNESN